MSGLREEPRAAELGSSPSPSRGAAPLSMAARQQAMVAGLLDAFVEHARRIAEADAALASELAAADAALERSLQQAEAHTGRRDAWAEEEYERLAAEISEKHDRRSGAAWAAYESTLAGATRTFERTRATIEEKASEAIWLAETEVESAVPLARKTFETVRGQVAAQRTRLGEFESTGKSWIGKLAPKGGDAAETSDQPASESAVTGDPKSKDIDAGLHEVLAALQAMRTRAISRIVRSGGALITPVLLGGAGAAAGGFAMGWHGVWPIVGGGAGVVLGLGAAVPMVGAARKQQRADYVEFAGAAARCRALCDRVETNAATTRDREIEDVTERSRAHKAKAKQDAAAALAANEKQRDETIAAAESSRDEQLAEADRRRDRATGELEAKAAEIRARAGESREQAVARARQAHAERTEAARADYAAERASAEDALHTAAVKCADTADRVATFTAKHAPEWASDVWSAWVPPHDPAGGVPLGALRVDGTADLTDLPDAIPAAVPPCLSVPAMLDLPGDASLLVEAAPEDRAAAIQFVQAFMLRLFTTVPPGRLRMTMLDPVGLGQSFAGFMRLADYPPATGGGSLVGARIWTEESHIERRLTDLTEHMENVIQKYLRRDFASIEAYNAVAGEIAEPYRVLVAADFPVAFNEAAARRLASVLDSGPRCGVYTVLLVDPEAKMPPGINLRELERTLTTVRFKHGRAHIAGEPRERAIFIPAQPPEDALTSRLLDAVGEAARDAKRVEVSIEALMPEPGKWWTGSTAEEVVVPVGRAGAARNQEFRLGKGTRQHALIAGKTGSGKSTLLHVLVTGLALWHSPDEIEFYLVDFKKGVEFKSYAEQALPHARAVAIESDREFGLSVLRKLDAELAERGERFRAAGVQDVAGWREARPSEPLPRIMLVIDEFQEFFTEDDTVAQDAAGLLDRLVRQGRAFGIHVVLGSQTLSGAYTPARSTIGQMGVRVALQCSEADSYLILDEDNGAARLLSRPGEAIYNDSGGLIEGNSPFQTAWLGGGKRDKLLRAIAEHARTQGVHRPPPILFEGNAPADPAVNTALTEALEGSAPTALPKAPPVWLGDPVAIAPPVHTVLRRQSGSNVLFVGQQADSTVSMLEAVVISTAAQHAARGPASAKFMLVEGTPEDDPLSRRLPALLDALPHEHRAAGWRDVADVLSEAGAELDRREGDQLADEPTWVVIINAVQRIRALRGGGDDFGFSFGGGDSDTGERPGTILARLLREGPGLGIFVLCSCDTAGNLSRTFDRSSVAEFGSRVLHQMSANDSATLCESTDASKLGLNRALLYLDDQGTTAKFRPYGSVDGAWAMDAARQIATRR